MKKRLEIEYISIVDCVPNKWNPNVMSDFLFSKEKRSILIHGFVDPITVRTVGDHKEIIDGEQRYKAMNALINFDARLSDDELDLLHANDDLMDMIDLQVIPAIDLGVVPDHVAQQLTIQLNELRGEADTLKLAELIAMLEENTGREELSTILPYREDEIQDLLDLLHFDWDGFKSEGQDQDEESWIDLTFRVPIDVLPIVESEIDRISDLLGLKPSLSKLIKRGLALEKICVLSSQTPIESLNDSSDLVKEELQLKPYQ